MRLRSHSSPAPLIGRDPEAILVSGACPKGADRICEEIWKRIGLKLELHPAKWRKPNGEKDWRAGFTRNEAMVDTAPDHLIAFIHNGSNGATHCLKYALGSRHPNHRAQRHGVAAAFPLRRLVPTHEE